MGLFHLWVAGKRVLAFVLATLEILSLFLTPTAALLREICRNGHFLKGCVNLSENFTLMVTSHAIHVWTVRLRNNVATTLPIEVFAKWNFEAYFFPKKIHFY